MKILMVLTSHDQLANRPQNRHLARGIRGPVFCLPGRGCRTDAGFSKRRTAPDPKSNLPEEQAPAMTRFKQDKEAQEQFSKTVKLSDMKSEDFETVFYVGGHGPMWDIVDNPDAIALIESTTPASLWPLEDELKRIGGIYEKAAAWAPFEVVDGRVLTGQNPASSTAAARHCWDCSQLERLLSR